MFDWDLKELKRRGFSFCRHQHILERGDDILILRKDGEAVKAKKKKKIDYCCGAMPTRHEGYGT